MSVVHSAANNHDSPWNSVPVRPLFRFPSARSLVKNHNTDPKELSLVLFDGTSHLCREIVPFRPEQRSGERNATKASVP